MDELKKRLTELHGSFLKVYEKLSIDDKLVEVAELEKEVAEPEIWKDVAKATEKNQELAKLNNEVQPWVLLKTQIDDMGELLLMSDESLKDEMAEQITAAQALDSKKTFYVKEWQQNGYFPIEKFVYHEL